MSNITATVGRPVQYIASNGITYAALISYINNDGGTVDVTTFSKSGTAYVERVVVSTVENARTKTTNVVLLTWPGR